MTTFITRRSALLGMASLAACTQVPDEAVAPPPVPGYEEIDDVDFVIPAVNPAYLQGNNRRAEVAYTGPDGAGSIVVDPYARGLYFVTGPLHAWRYGIAVGRAGLGFTGTGTIQRKERWPRWQPTQNMIRRFPEMYAQYAAGLPGGLINPLGARALYLYRNGRDTYFRIHGTNEQSSIGRATSAGCIRLFNQDIIHLFNQVPMGTFVRVRSLQESLEQEGAYMDDLDGRAVPVDPAASDAIARANAAAKGYVLR